MKVALILVQKAAIDISNPALGCRTLYSYRKEGCSSTEFDTFIEDPILRMHSGHPRIISRMADLLFTTGFKRILLEADGNSEHRSYKLRENGFGTEAGLRLFGAWFSDRLFLVGSGGLKPQGRNYSRTEMNPVLKRASDELAAIRAAILADPTICFDKHKSDFIFRSGISEIDVPE